MSIKYISVCSGIEAASVAWHDMGWEPVAFSEIEPFPSEVLKTRFPNTPNWGDMTKFNTWPDANVNLLVGGTPCQSFSVAGLRQGLKDPRGNLMLTFLAIAERYKPKWIVWENVPGVLSSNGGKDFGSFLGALGELGYGWAYRVLDAQWFGVAQRRRRVFVVGCLGDQRAAAEVLFESESVSRNPAPSREKRQATAGATEEGVGSGSRYWGSDPECSDTVTSKWHKGSGGPSGSECGLFVSQPTGINGDVAGTLDANYYKGCGSANYGEREVVMQPTVIDRAAFNQGTNAQYEPRIEQDETMSSIVAKRPHAVAHAFKIRGGSPTETGEYGGTPGKAAGKGYLGSDELAFTLAATQDQQIAFRKSKRAQSEDDHETWVDDGVSNTLNSFDTGDVRTTHAVVAVDTFNQTTNEHTSQTLGSSATDVNHYGAVMIPQTVDWRTTQVDDNMTQTLKTDLAKMSGPCVSNPPMAIRRLTPVEYERLQGFPDNWTQIPWKKKPAEECPDGPRYKACGNSMAVPCMKWLGQRIQKAQNKIQDGKDN
jgi:site-specific DNA-cytosine methylase